MNRKKGEAGAESFLPDAGRRPPPLDALADAVQRCRGCELYRHASQAVFGDGPPEARLVLIGEQPGEGTIGAAARRICQFSDRA